MEQRFLGEILHRRAGVPMDRLETLFTVQREKGIDLVDLLVNGNLLDEATIAKALADESELPYVEKIDLDKIPTALATRLPIGFAKAHKVLVTNEDDYSVHILMGDPFDTTALDEIRVLFGKAVEPCVSPSEKIEDAINRVYERDAGGGELESNEEHVDDEVAGGDILDSDDEAPVIRWVNSLFLQAMKERASDIHIEPEEKEVIVRYRIDGELYVARRAPRAFMSSIVSRIKIESALNIAEKRLPQDGRISKKIAGKGFDIRVSTIPTSRGYERIVMRLLNKSSVLLDLPDLGFSARDYALMDNLIHRPDGIILVTGPTGSGKTTTLYACLNRINQPNINILTAEDPVEYELPQIHQVHVNAKIGLSFASALRAFLRQDPDVVMVGEIRDKETVEIAINASLTGHLVLSTIHTNDAAGAFTRMIDMGVEPFLLRSAVIGILAQRLVRMLCPTCKEPYQATATELDELGITPERSAQRRKRMTIAGSRYYPKNVASADVLENVRDANYLFYRPKGCDKCAQTGFMGRRGIYELLMMDDLVGPLVLKGADAQAVKRAAIEQGMDSLRDDGARKVIAGLTTVDEILVATSFDDVEAEAAHQHPEREGLMAVFAYTGLTVSNGKKVSGVRDADNPKILRAQLRREGVLLTEASEEKRGKKAGRSINFAGFFNRVSVGDIAMLTRQLATLVGAGIPLVDSVSALIEQVEKEELQKTLAQIRDRLNEGTSLAKALEPFPHIFPPIYTNMVAAGEASGTLETVLERLADFMEKQAHLRSKVGGALAYPILMLLLGTGLMTTMMIVVVPKVTNIYATLDRALPWYTALLIFVSSALSSNQMLGFVTSLCAMVFTRKALAPGTKRTAWTAAAIVSALTLVLFLFAVSSMFAYGTGIVIGLVVGFMLARFFVYIATPAGEVWKDGIKLRMPLFGPVFRMLAVSRFSRTLATLLKSGVPLLKAMEIVRHVLDNAMLSKIVEEAAGSIREGESISVPLKRSKQFPPIVVHMIAVGEKSGQLESMLENVSRAYDAQVDTRVQAMTSLLEPLIIVFMGGGVGFIAFSILMPLIQMNDFVN